MKAIERADEAKAEIKIFRKDDDVVAEHEFDPIAFDAAVASWYGSARERMLEIGFATTDEFMKAIRGR